MEGPPTLRAVKPKRGPLLFFAGMLAVALSGSFVQAGEVVLAENGTAKFPIVISNTASDTTRQNAQVLASYLGKMTGAMFAVETGDGSRGLALGTPAEFSALPKTFDAAPAEPRRVEEYLLYSHPQGLLLVGATDLAAQNAMWDFLWRQGYRQYFPGPTWEIVPKVPRLLADYDEVQKPDYYMRKLGYSAGTNPDRLELFKDWERKNRMQSGFVVQASHSYQAIVAAKKEAFQSHPEYFAQVNGKREFSDNGKFNISNPDLRKLVVESRLEEFRKNPQLLCVSIDPSDGGGYDESEEAKSFGSISNQVIFLANEVADAVAKEFPGRMVGMYGYGYYASPPTIPVRPNIVILVTTAFRNTPLTMQEQMEGWAKQGAMIGIRDYLSVPIWDFDLPSKAKFSEYHKIVKKWKDYYDWGARFYFSESSDNWGINGLLYYAASRMLWNVEDKAYVEGVQEEFLKNCFGPVANEIRPYYQALGSRPLMGTDLVNRLYTAIKNAREKTVDPTIVARLEDLTLYVRYLELYNRYTDFTGEERRTPFKDIATHLYRGRFHIVDSVRGVMRSIARDSGLKWERPETLGFRRGEPLWAKDMPPYTSEEIAAFIEPGVKNNARLGYDPVSYSDDLVPAAKLFAEEKVSDGHLSHSRKKALYYTWADAPGSKWKITITNTGTEAMDGRAEIWAAEEVLDEPIETKPVKIDPGKSAEIELTSSHAGRHWIYLTGPKVEAQVKLDPAKPWTVTSVPEAPIQAMQYMTNPDNSVYFYVPKGTKLLGGFAQGQGKMFNPEGKEVVAFNRNDGGEFFKLDVPSGMDGRLWKLDWRGHTFRLLTAPSYFAATPRDLLLPREVVEADKVAN